MWTEHADATTGLTYFYNTQTGESRWTKPGWRQIIQDGVVFYYNDMSGEKSWYDPAWQVFLDPTYNLPYWYNSETQERTWVRPPNAVEWMDDVGGTEPVPTDAVQEAAAPVVAIAAAAAPAPVDTVMTDASPVEVVAAAAPAVEADASAALAPLSSTKRRVSSRLSMFVGLDPRASISLRASITPDGALLGRHAMRRVSEGSVLSQHPEDAAGDALASRERSGSNASDRSSDGSASVRSAPDESSLLEDLAAPEDASAFAALVPPQSAPILPAGLIPLRDAATADAQHVDAASSLTSTPVHEVLDATARAAGEYRRRLLTHSTLSKLTYFKGISLQEARTLAGAFTLWACRSGTPVVTEGDFADCLFLVARGSMLLYSARKYGGGNSSPRDTAPSGGTSRAATTTTAHTAVPVPLTSVAADRAHVRALETRVPEGSWFGIESLMCDAFRHEWSAVASGGKDMIGTLAASDASSGSRAATGMPVSEASEAAIRSLVRACGASHLLVLTRQSLAAAMGSEWIQHRKLVVLTGVLGVPFTATTPGPWSPGNTASAFAAASAVSSTAAQARLATARATNTMAATTVGFAASDSSVSLVAANSDALAMLTLHLRDVPFFGRLEGEALEEFARSIVILRRRKDTVLIVEGSPADAFFIVVHGHLKIMAQGMYASSMGPGSYVGELSMLKGVPARATVVTSEDSILLAVPRPAFEKLTRKSGEVKAAFSDRIAALLDLAKPWKLLRLFGALTEYQLGWLARSSRTVLLSAGVGVRLCRRHNEGCFIVATGQGNITMDGVTIPAHAGRPIGVHNLLATSTSDPVLGDSDDDAAILVQAVTDVTLVRITRQDVIAILGSSASVSESALGNFDATSALLSAAVTVADRSNRGNELMQSMYDHAYASIIARCRSVRPSLLTALTFDDASIAGPLLECAIACDEFTQRALTLSPVAAPLLVMSPTLRKRLEQLVLRYSVTGQGYDAVVATIPASVRRTLLSVVTNKRAESIGEGDVWPTRDEVATGLACMKAWPATLLADVASSIDFVLFSQVRSFRASAALRQALKSITTDASTHAPGRQDARDKALNTFMNSAVCFNVSKINKYGRWHKRSMRILIRAAVLDMDDSGSAMSRFPITAIGSVERMSKEGGGKQLRINFQRQEAEKDWTLRFENAESRDTFITLVHMLAPDIPITEDCMMYLGSGRVTYDVSLLTRGMTLRRALTIDTVKRTLSRAHRDDSARPQTGALAQDAALLADDGVPDGMGTSSHSLVAPASTASTTPAHDFAITLSTRMEPSTMDPCRLKLSFGSESESFEVMFPTSFAREHFAGALRTLIYNVNVPAARLLGLYRAGVVPDTVSVFIGTFNCGDSKPPKDVASLAAWIPAHRYDIIAVGLQECNARDDWIKAIEAALLPANAPSMTAAPVYLAAGFTPAQASSTDTSTAKERELDPDLASSTVAKEATKSSGGALGLFSRLTGRSDKDKEKEKDARSTGSGSTAIMGFDSMTAPVKETQSAAHGALETYQEGSEMLGFARDVATGLLSSPTPAATTRGRSTSSAVASGDGSVPAAAPKTSGKAGKLLGLGGPAAPPPGRTGGTAKVDTKAPPGGGTIRPDPPVTPSPYQTVCAATLWGIHLVIFARATVAQHISHVQSATTATGIGGVLGNKGGVGVGLIYKEATSMAFVTSHLAARPERTNQRAENYSEICRSLRIGTENTAGQFLHQFDHVFWFGDLNYRIDMGSMGTPEEFNKIQTLIAARDYPSLLAADQLAKELDAGRIFGGFREGAIRFAPTYRMEKGKEEYSNKRYQNASYTDRVLWRSREGLRSAVSLLYYDACFGMNMSDHRPVSAAFVVGTKLPYLSVDNVDAVNQSGNRVTCTISAAYLRYDDVVLPRAEQAAAEVGLDVSAAVDSIQRARSKVLAASLLSEPDADSGAAASASGPGSSHGDGASTARPTLVSVEPGFTPADAGSTLLPSGKAEDYYVEISAPFLESSVETYFGTQPSMHATGAAGTSSSVGMTGVPPPLVSQGSFSAPAAVRIGSVSAEWAADAIPDMSPLLPDARWLQHQALHFAVRRKGGMLVGQAEVCLRDAYACMQREIPLAPDALSLSSIFSHPILSKAFAVYLAAQRSDESLHFYRAYVAYQELTAVGGVLAPAEVRFAAASVIAETFLWPSAARMVNVPGAVIGNLKAAFSRAETTLSAPPAAPATAPTVTTRSGAAMSALFTTASRALDAASSPTAAASASADEVMSSDVFNEAGEEVFRQMERESVPGFRKMYASLLASCGMQPVTLASSAPLSPSSDAGSRVSTNLTSAAAADAHTDLPSAYATAQSTSCAPFAVPILRDGCTVGLLRGSLFLTCLDAVSERSRRLAELHRLLKRRSSTRRVTDAGLNTATAAFMLDETAGLNDARGRSASNRSALSGLAALSSAMSGALSGGASSTAAAGPVMNSMTELAKLPTPEKARISALVEQLLSGTDFSISSPDDYALLADMLMSSALTERESTAAAASSTSEDPALAKVRAQMIVLLRATNVAFSASSGDKSPATRALRVLLQLSLHRLARAEGLSVVSQPRNRVPSPTPPS